MVLMSIQLTGMGVTSPRRKKLSAACLAAVVAVSACGSSSHKAIPFEDAPAAGDVITVGTVDPSHFGTLPVGATLPADEYCSAHVRPTPEVRKANATFNLTSGATAPPQTGYFARVTGNFTGTTDEIIQWTSCKWGIDEDIVRAQVAKESWWYQKAVSDWSTAPTHCAPGHGIGVDGKKGQCPESIGLLQLRFPYIPDAFPTVTVSSAYNMDYALAYRRQCFEGLDTWLNTVERGSDYAAGDLWGCIGTWFAGRWHTAAADQYMNAVQDYLSQRVWETHDFLKG